MDRQSFLGVESKPRNVSLDLLKELSGATNLGGKEGGKEKSSPSFT